MKIKILQHKLQNALIDMQSKYRHLIPCPQKKFNVGDIVLVCGNRTATVCEPVNDQFDLTRNTWVQGIGFASCYANHNLTRHPDQSVRKLK